MGECIGIFMKAEGYGGFDVGDAVSFMPIDADCRPGVTNSDIFSMIKIALSVKEATEYFFAEEPGDIKLKPNKKKRAVKLDFKALPDIKKGEVLDVPYETIVAARVVKPETPVTPFIVGKDPFTVG